MTSYDAVKNHFLKYIDTFFCNDELYNYNYKLKKQHSLIVVQHAINICTLPEIDNLCKKRIVLAALLHDAGRFLQFKEYQTFHDADSVDHGQLSKEIIIQEKFLQPIERELIPDILHAVLFHNKLHIPCKSSTADITLKAVRDADKLDILRVITEHLEPTQEKPLNSHLPDTGEISPLILNSIFSGKQICYSQRKSYDDMKLTMLNWIQELYFSYSYKHVFEMNYVDLILNSIKGDCDKNKLRSYFAALFSEKLKCIIT